MMTTPANQPTLVMVNDKPALSFDGENDYLYLPSARVLPTSLSIFAVFLDEGTTLILIKHTV